MRLGRNRIIFFRFCRRNKMRKNNAVFYIISVVLLVIVLVLTFENNLKPIILSIGKTKAEFLASVCVNQAIAEEITDSGLKYEDLMTFQKNNNGEITALQANIVKMNQLKSAIAMNINQKIEELDVAHINAPLGFFSASGLFGGWGPKIPIRLIPVGSVNIDFRNNFYGSGINQTSHEIFIDVTNSVTMVLPIAQSTATVSTSVVVAQTIIVGNVPQSYTNIESTGKSTQEAALEIIK